MKRHLIITASIVATAISLFTGAIAMPMSSTKNATVDPPPISPPLNNAISKECSIECDETMDYQRCNGSHLGLMRVCENSQCLQAHCTADADCVTFAHTFGLYDSCRTYTCLYGQCIDQFAVSIPAAPMPGTMCSSDKVGWGMCDTTGSCRVFPCSTDADCPPYSLECSKILCNGTEWECISKPVVDGAPCSTGTCSNGSCN